MKTLLPASLATAVLLPVAASAAVVVNDSSWNTPATNTKVGDSSGINYWGSSGSTGALSLNESNQLVLTQGGRAILVNFPKQTLTDVGDSLTVSFTFALSVDSGASSQLLVGLFDNTPGTALTANGYGNAPAEATNYTGYIVGASTNSTANSTVVYKRNATANLTASTNNTNATGLGTTGGGTNPALAANTFYTSTLTLTRVETGLELAYSLSSSSAYTFSVIDTDSPDFSFTTLEFRGNSALYGSGETLTLSNLNITFTPAAIPEPASFAALAGLGALGLVAMRRRRA
jgi:PEP-CTERM putative exosortase interaction domain